MWASRKEFCTIRVECVCAMGGQGIWLGIGCFFWAQGCADPGIRGSGTGVDEHAADSCGGAKAAEKSVNGIKGS